MNKHDIQVLTAYNRWANARILGAAASLTEEQFLTPDRYPHGGLRGTLVHALFAEMVWRLRWQSMAPDYRYRLKPEDFPNIGSLRARWTEEENSLMTFVAALTDEQLNTAIDYTSTEGGQHRRLIWEGIAHMVNHGTQHRTEAAAMLTALSHSPGDIDLIVFLNEG
jgi:uncharacterized damage-inducible protein DinB